MNDQFIEVKTTNIFQRFKNSVVGIFLGIILFFASFGLLYWNEGRVNFSVVAQSAIEISATANPTAKIGELISVTGTLTSAETLGDQPYLGKGAYVALKRKSEMYAWSENSETSTKRSIGNSETKNITTYTYTKTWTENPENSSSFRQTMGHENPTKSIESVAFQVSQAELDNYQFNFNGLNFPLPTNITLSPENVLSAYQSKQTGDYLFMGKGTLTKPEIGDIRLSYQALKKDIQATIFGKLTEKNQITAYPVRKNVSFYRLFVGTREQAIADLTLEHKIWTWIFRGSGFLMMWIGLGIVLDPLIVILDFVPFLGDIARATSWLATFIIAAILSGLTITISMILHNPIMVYSAIGLGCFILYRWTKQKKVEI